MKKILLAVLALVFSGNAWAQKAEILQQKIIENGGTGQYKAIAVKVNTLTDYVIFQK